MLSAFDGERDVREQVLVAGGELDPLGLDNRPAASLGLEELEAQALCASREERDLAAELCPLLLQAADVRQLGLSALGEALLVAEALDEALEARDVDVDPVCGRRRGGEPRSLLAPPVVPGTREVRRAAGLELEHRGRHRFEEPAVVRDEDDRSVDRLQLALQPLEARHVQVVGRLVEEQQVRVAAERAGQRGAGQLSAGEGRQRALEIRRREAEVARDRVEPLAPRVAAGMLEAGLGLRVACAAWPRRDRRPPLPLPACVAPARWR